MSNTKIDAPARRQEIIIHRKIHAPRDLVFKTITDPLLIPKWWGPHRLTTSVHKMVVMPGGSWRFLQRDKEGKEYAFHGVYHDVVIPIRLVYTMEYEDMPGHATLNIDTLEEHTGLTSMISQVIFQSVEDRDQMLEWGMEEGTIATTDRLNELLADKAQERKEATMKNHEGNGKSLTITRLFNAPREKVWKRWTDPNHLMCWWGPKDFTAPYAMIDLRPGGKYLSCMRGPDGKEYWGTGIFKEIVEPNRIIFTDSFADKLGNVVPASYYGMPSDYPLEMEVELTFEDLGDKTRMVLEHCGLPEGEQSELTRQSWNESFDKLDECLE